MVRPLLAAVPAHCTFDDRTDWDTFASDGFPVAGMLNPLSGNWAELVGQVWSSDWSTLILDDIAVTFSGTEGTWSIDSNFTGLLTAGFEYQLLVRGMFGDATPSGSHPFTMQS